MMKTLFTAAFACSLMICGPSLAQDFVQSGEATTLPQRDGKELYNAVCSGCHMPDGMGAIGAGFYPKLAESDFVGSPEGVAQWIIHGYRAMPPLGAVVDDEQIAAIVNYLQTNLGNSYDGKFTAGEVADLR